MIVFHFGIKRFIMFFTLMIIKAKVDNFLKCSLPIFAMLLNVINIL